MTTKAGAAGALAYVGASTVVPSTASAAPTATFTEFTDDMFDVQAVLDGAWDDTAFYQRGDQRGTLHEVTPEKTARALKLVGAGRAVTTYNLGELMVNGFPAYVTTPPRIYNQRLTVLGYEPPTGFEGVVQSTEPLGANRASVHEERFKVTEDSPEYTYTYQIGTQLDSLNHIGVGPVFYGGHRGPGIAETWGTSKLGSEHMGPIVTRGVLLDVLGVKLAHGPATDIEFAANGNPHLLRTYRITIEDLLVAMRFGGISSIEPGDVVLIRTGWNQVVSEPAKYLTTEPGIYLREARWLAGHRPAIIGSDNWGLEVTGRPDVHGDNAFPCHQELLTHFGVRIGEAIVTDRLAEDEVFEFVYLYTPQYALGATAGNTPPAALGRSRRS